PGKTAEASIRAKSLEPLAATTNESPTSIDDVQDLAEFVAKTATEEAIKPVMKSSPNSSTAMERVNEKIAAEPVDPEDPAKQGDVIDVIIEAGVEVDPNNDGNLDPTATSTSSSTSTSTSSSTTSTTVFVPNVCGNCVWEAGELC